MERRINYTVIIPNKNNHKLLQRLLSSIPERKDIEIIVVDDNSEDKFTKGCEYPGMNRNNTRVIFDKTSKGAGHARNVGIQHSRGLWLLFADSDDFYNPHAFDSMDKYVNSDADIIFFDVNSVDTNTLEKSNRDKYYGEYIKLYLTGIEPNGDSIKYRKWEPWYKMLKRDFILRNNVSFEEIPRCNDMSFSLLASYKASKIGAIDKKLYCVTTNPDSITKKKIKKDVFWYCILCEIKKNYLYKKIGHPEWRSTYIFIMMCILKNNGLYSLLDYIFMLFNRRREIIEYRKSLQYFFCND